MSETSSGILRRRLPVIVNEGQRNGMECKLLALGGMRRKKSESKRKRSRGRVLWPHRFGE